VRERQSIVSRECPDLPARRGCLANLRRHEAHHNGYEHEHGTDSALRRVVENRNEWLLRTIVENGVEVSGAEDDRHACDESHGCVDEV